MWRAHLPDPLGPIVWDEVHGWLHLSGWYACRNPDNGASREVMASPSREQL